MRHASIKSFQDAADFLGSKPSRPYAHNTRITRDGDEIIVTYHNNPVVTFTFASIVLSSCGWKTITTKERLNWFLPAGWVVYQDKSVWYLSDRRNGWENAKRYVFQDGITIYNTGEVTNAGTDDDSTRQTIKRIKRYVDGYIKALLSGDVSQPSGGDCWYCSMQTDSGESLGDATHNTDHIESHMEDSYYVPSLLMNAEKYNHRMCALTKDGIARLWEHMEVSDWQKSIVERDVKSSLTAYLKHVLNIAA